MRTLLLALLISIPLSEPKAQLAFDRDSVISKYAFCDGDTAPVIRVWVKNTSDTARRFKLRFNAGRTWQIVENQDSLPDNDNLLVPARDSFWIDVDHSPVTTQIPEPAWFRDPLFLDEMSSSIPARDTLYLNARRRRAVFAPLNANFDLAVVAYGDSLTHTIILHNIGDAPYTTDVIQHHPDWSVRGLVAGQTIAVGDSATLTLTFHATQYGTHRSNFLTFGPCGQFQQILEAKVHAPEAHWAVLAVRDTIRTCQRGSKFEVTIRNTSQESSRIDSVRFSPDKQSHWFTDGIAPGTVLGSGAELRFPVERIAGGQSTKLVLFASPGITDTLLLDIDQGQVASPIIRNHRDTLLIDWKAKDSLSLTIEIENYGTASYKLNSVGLTGSPLWRIDKLDTVTWVGLRKRVPIVFVFAGSEIGGDHSMTYFVQGIPCDTILSQTIIMRIPVASVSEIEELLPKLAIYPLPTSDYLTISFTEQFAYELIDMLGTIVATGRSDSNTLRINITDLANGSYVVRATSKGKSKTARVVIQ